MNISVKWFWRILAGLGLLAVVAAGSLFIGLPDIDTLSDQFNTASLRITDRHGRLLYEVLPDNGGRHSIVPVAEVALALKQATIATEDKSFYINPGIDHWGVIRAVWINLQGGETVSGGSTITQQVARNLLLSEEERAERSLRRKLREAILAFRLSQALAKDEILGLYLNQTYYGGLAYGVEAAAQTYFGKPAAELDLAESALIAGLPQAPGLYNPYTDLDAAIERQAIVLGLMEAAGYISSTERERAEAEPLSLRPEPYPIEAPHFVWMVRAELDDLAASAEIDLQAGLTVRTSLDLDWQHQAEDAIAWQLDELRNNPQEGIDHNVNNAALVALDPHTGETLALTGSADFFNDEISGAVNMAVSPRQPGSALKPLVYATTFAPALPAPWTAATLLWDIESNFVTHDGSPYTPHNYDGLEHGPVLARQALASSLNIPAVLALDEAGVENVISLAETLGIHSFGDPNQYDLSLALGGGAVSLYELTGAYMVFANRGVYRDQQLILEIRDSQDELIYLPAAPQGRPVLDERVAWLISDILSDDEARSLGFGRFSILQLDRPAAVKTGTTSNFHDNWTVGYTPDVVVGVWVGNSDYQAMNGVSGLSGAAPIWHQFMRAVLTNVPEKEFVQPPGLEQVEVCALSGFLPTLDCPYRKSEWFIEGTAPTEVDTIYEQVQIDQRTGVLADANTPHQYRHPQLLMHVPPQAYGWARSENLTLAVDFYAALANSTVRSSQASLGITSPRPNSVFTLASGLNVAAQRLSIQAYASSEFAALHIYLDGELLEILAEAPYETWWSLSAGQHEVWVEGVTAQGEVSRSEVVVFEVIDPADSEN